MWIFNAAQVSWPWLIYQNIYILKYIDIFYISIYDIFGLYIHKCPAFQPWFTWLVCKRLQMWKSYWLPRCSMVLACDNVWNFAALSLSGHCAFTTSTARCKVLQDLSSHFWQEQLKYQIETVFKWKKVSRPKPTTILIKKPCSDLWIIPFLRLLVISWLPFPSPPPRQPGTRPFLEVSHRLCFCFPGVPFHRSSYQLPWGQCWQALLWSPGVVSLHASPSPFELVWFHLRVCI